MHRSGLVGAVVHPSTLASDRDPSRTKCSEQPAEPADSAMLAAVDEVTFSFPSADEVQIQAYRWSAGSQPRAIVQLAHGMGEHALRYRRLARALTDQGYLVYADDHRGHGRTAGGPSGHGRLGAAGWQGLVDDLGRLNAHARTEHPRLPLILLGHSMGSFALQQYLLDHAADVDGAVLSGTTAIDQLMAAGAAGGAIDLSDFNAPFETRTGFEWLTRDEAEVDAYVADPDCGFGLDATASAQMNAGTAATADPDRLAAIRPDLPILLQSGDDDPLAGGGALIDLVAQRYRDAGVIDVTVKRYPGARHEVFNEINRDEITADLLGWLDRVVG